MRAHLVSLCVLVFGGCTPSSPATQIDAEAESDVAEPAESPVIVDPPPPPMPGDAVIELRRTTCYGTCPAYHVTVSATGEVRWTGKSHVKREGERTWAVDPRAVEPLWQALDALAWQRLPPNTASADCPELWSDNPSFELVVRGGGETRAVSHYLGCRGNPDYDALVPLSEQVDVVAQTAAAVGSRR